MRGGGRGGDRGGGGGVPAGLNIMAPMFNQGGNPAMAAPGMLFPPPGMPGFPGMEQLFLGGAGPIPGFHPGNYAGAGQPFFHPALAGGPPGQFGNQFRGFPGGSMGRGMGRGFVSGGRGGMIPGMKVLITMYFFFVSFICGLESFFSVLDTNMMSPIFISD